jgi:hypothetical protein
MIKVLKLAIGIQILIFLISCGNGNYQRTVEQEVKKEDSLSILKLQNQGIWVLSNYFDSVVIEKSIAKFRMNNINWSSLLLNFDNDTLRIYGSIYKQKIFIDYSGDTLPFKRIYENDLWSIILANDETIIKSFKKENPEQKYIYRRMNEVEKQYIKIDENNWFSIDKGVEELFNVVLISGKYLYKKNDTIAFEKNGQIKNFKNYTNFEIDNYFGTNHYFGNLDNIALISENSRETWNWKFIDNILILNKIKPKNDDYEKGFYLTNEIIKLKKIN